MKALIWVTLFLSSTSAWGLTVTSLNIQWYGRGGVLEGSLDDEYRDQRISQFINQQMPASDVFVFQEVTDKKRVEKLVKGFKCYSYASDQARHQHVVICSNPKIVDSSTVEYAVQLGSPGLRPAMILNVKYDNKIISIVGLHLKAKRDGTEKRIQQVTALASSKLLGKNAILIGDFNTYDKLSTENDLGDSEYFNELLAPVGYVQSINETNSHTYLSFAKRVFDRVWSRGVNIKYHQVFGPCRTGSVVAPFSKVSFFKRFVSDHCAIQISL